METITNAATSVVNTASGYIYGTNNTAAEPGKEPVSGQSGKGTADEPFDKGNEETATGAPAASTGTSATKTTDTATDTPSLGSSKTSASDSAPTSTTIGHHNPADGADPASGQKPFQKQQGGDRPNEAPTGEQSEAVKETKDEGEELLKKRDPNDHSGEPMKMHDGSEEKVNEEEDDEHPGQEGGKKQGGGTGEEWIKTSGLQADGGDFDAAKAGAGREADRLLEEKGIARDERGGMVGTDGSPVPTDHKNPSPSGGAHSKVKTIDKLKEKLHIGTGKGLK